MLAAVVEEYGPPESVRVAEVVDPVAGPGQVVIRVSSAAVNYPDVLIAADKYQISVPVPFTPGSELAGTVESVGDGVDQWSVGDQVYGGAMVGAFAQRIALPAAGLSRVPDGVDLDSAAAFGVVYRTAYHALRSVAEVGPGDWVVVLGAAGGVGLAAVDIAVLLGARVLAAASSADKLAVCSARGAEAVVNYDTEDLKVRIKEITGAGADAVIDPVGGAYAEQALRSTRWGGRFVTVGFAAGDIPRIPLNLVLLKGVVIKGFEIRTFAGYAPEAAARDNAELDALFAAGKIKPHISAAYPLDEVSTALADLAERRAIGKVLVHPWA